MFVCLFIFLFVCLFVCLFSVVCCLLCPKCKKSQTFYKPHEVITCCSLLLLSNFWVHSFLQYPSRLISRIVKNVVEVVVFTWCMCRTFKYFMLYFSKNAIQNINFSYMVLIAEHIWRYSGAKYFFSLAYCFVLLPIPVISAWMFITL